jgi:UDP-N-acetylmuramoyl-L-alanyl-D-glutamate--2,6-diaminopimelate ligase
MKLKRLLKDLPVEWKGSKDIEITGISHHSKRVVPGHLFIARKGEKFDGWSYIEEALHNGASAVLTPFYNPFYKQVQQIIYPNPQELESILAARFYEHPGNELTEIAVTGTCGKTTVSSLIQQLLEKLTGTPCGLIGTIEYRTGAKTYQADLTTPDSLTLHRLLREMKNSSCSYVCMEASSHGISQGRLSELPLKIGIFTNLNQDHLDYHKTMQEYALAKQALFDSEKTAAHMHTAVICHDTPWGEFMVQKYKGHVLFYGRNANANLHLLEEKLEPTGSSFTFSFEGQKYKAHTSLVGSHNVDNCLAAIGALMALGFDIPLILSHLPKVRSVRGRLERVPSPWGYVYVDYSHKPEALDHVLETLRKVYPGKRLICLFGCGGDRDRGKRPIMGKIASGLSDDVWVTSDNPRSEDPQHIIQEILQGISPDSKAITHVNADRQAAIYEALASMSKEDVLLIAGKGHETYQLLGPRIIAFDDVEIAQNWPGFQKGVKKTALTAVSG